MSSPETPVATVIPLQWLRQLEHLAYTKDSTVSEVIRDAIEQYLTTINDSNPELTQLKQQLQQLSQKVQTLSIAQEKFNSLDLRVCILEKRVLPPQLPLAVQTEEEEDTEDEPDEILSDFL